MSIYFKKMQNKSKVQNTVFKETVIVCSIFVIRNRYVQFAFMFSITFIISSLFVLKSNYAWSSPYEDTYLLSLFHWLPSYVNSAEVSPRYLPSESGNGKGDGDGEKGKIQRPALYFLSLIRETLVQRVDRVGGEIERNCIEVKIRCLQACIDIPRSRIQCLSIVHLHAAVHSCHSSAFTSAAAPGLQFSYCTKPQEAFNNLPVLVDTHCSHLLHFGPSIYSAIHIVQHDMILLQRKASRYNMGEGTFLLYDVSIHIQI